MFVEPERIPRLGVAHALSHLSELSDLAAASCVIIYRIKSPPMN